MSSFTYLLPALLIGLLSNFPNFLILWSLIQKWAERSSWAFLSLRRYQLPKDNLKAKNEINWFINYLWSFSRTVICDKIVASVCISILNGIPWKLLLFTFSLKVSFAYSDRLSFYVLLNIYSLLHCVGFRKIK